MTRLPSFPKIDLTSFDLSKLPSIDLPKFDLADVDDKIVDTVKNAAYLTVGLGVAAFERLDSARRSANSVASDALDSLSSVLSSTVDRVTKLAA